MSAIVPSVILCGIYSWRGWVEIPEPRPLWRPCGARRRRPTFCGNICSVVFVPHTTHTPFKGGCIGRDGERVASPAGLSVPATFVPLVRGRAASLERGTDNVVTKPVAVLTQDACRLTAARIERDMEPLQRLKALQRQPCTRSRSGGARRRRRRHPDGDLLSARPQ